jgi:hypothetical protein
MEILDRSKTYLNYLRQETINRMQAASRIRQEGEEKASKELLEVIDFMLDMVESYGVPVDAITENPNQPDMVNHPNHYTMGQYEVIDVIKDWLTEEEFRGYIKGNALKYVSRERLKNGDEDLKKTIFYLNYMVNGKKSDRSE